MSNIFQISNELASIYDELEECGGELTPELEDKLTITQSEFKTKVEGYLNVIKQVENDIEACDKEAKRLTALKKSKQNTVDRLKSIMAWAIEQFGESNKSGNKYVDLGTAKITVRTTDKVEVNDEFAESIVDSTFAEIRAITFSRELNSNYISDLITTPESKMEGITANISVDVPLKDLLKLEGDTFIKAVMNYGRDFKAKANISKSALKDNLKENPDAYPELACLKHTKTLTIK